VFYRDKILVLRYIVLVAHMELVACSWGPHMQLFTAVLTLHTFQYSSWVLHYTTWPRVSQSLCQLLPCCCSKLSKHMLSWTSSDV